MGKYKNGKYEPSSWFLFTEKVGFIFYIVFFGTLGIGAIILFFNFLPSVIAVILSIIVLIVIANGIRNEYEVKQIRCNKEKHGTWGSGNPYPIGTSEHRLHDQLKNINNNLDDINRKL